MTTKDWANRFYKVLLEPREISYKEIIKFLKENENNTHVVTAGNFAKSMKIVFGELEFMMTVNLALLFAIGKLLNDSTDTKKTLEDTENEGTLHLDNIEKYVNKKAIQSPPQLKEFDFT